jgi:hypothetical protein
VTAAGLSGSSEGLDAVEDRTEATLFDLQVITRLQIHPEPFRGAEEAGEPRRGVGA